MKLPCHPLFSRMHPDTQALFCDANWPSHHTLNQLAKKQHKPITFVEQHDKPKHFEWQYEPRIYLKKEVLTRTENWHDLFNAAIWFSFPLSKCAINAWQYQHLLHRHQQQLPQRSPLENFLTLFDENGVLIVSSRQDLLDDLKQHQWHRLFVEKRHLCEQHLQHFILGHALYEKALAPYIGMTAKCLMIPVDESFQQLSLGEQYQWLDHYLANYIHQQASVLTPKDLSPLPILGLPGIDPRNQQPSFYDNHDYFRPPKASP